MSFHSEMDLFYNKNCPDCLETKLFTKNGFFVKNGDEPCCFKCHKMIMDGDAFLFRRYGEYDTIPHSKIELQIQWFESHRERLLFSDADELDKRTKDMQTSIFDNVEDKELKTVMRSYVRQNCGNVRTAFLNAVFKHALQNEIEYSKDRDFFYRQKPYPENIILKLIVYEYFLALSGDNFIYVELEDIHQYLDEVFD